MKEVVRKKIMNLIVDSLGEVCDKLDIMGESRGFVVVDCSVTYREDEDGRHTFSMNVYVRED